MRLSQKKSSSKITGKGGIFVNIEDNNIQFWVSASVWNDEPQNINGFITANFETDGHISTII